MHELVCRSLRISVWMSLLFIVPSLSLSAARVVEQCDELKWDDTDELMLADNQTVEPAPSPAVEAAPIQEAQGYNSSVRPFVTGGANLWIRGEALYWRASEDNLYYAYTGNNANGGRFRDVKTVGFDWDWGFRLGIGYTIPRDRWDLALTWTHFHTETKSHVSADAPNRDLYINWWLVNHLSMLGEGQSAQGTWRPHLDQLDLSIGREFYVGRKLTLRPNAGLRNAWIDQQLNVTFRTSTGDAVVNMSNDFWGFGFFGGLDTKWMFTSDWHLFANGAAAILYGRFDITQKGIFNRALHFEETKDFQSGKGVLDIQAGIEWAHLFFKNRFGVTFRVGYEYHLYADQSQFPLPAGNTFFSNSYTPVGGDLAYQGLFLSGQFDF